MASYYFSKEFQLCLILQLSHVTYLLLGEFSLYKKETSSDDIPIEKLCEKLLYWEIAHLFIPDCFTMFLITSVKTTFESHHWQ